MTLTYFVRYKTDLRVIIQAIYTHKHNAENETKRKKTQLFKGLTDVSRTGRFPDRTIPGQDVSRRTIPVHILSGNRLYGNVPLL